MSFYVRVVLPDLSWIGIRTSGSVIFVDCAAIQRIDQPCSDIVSQVVRKLDVHESQILVCHIVDDHELLLDESQPISHILPAQTIFSASVPLPVRLTVQLVPGSTANERLVLADAMRAASVCARIEDGEAKETMFVCAALQLQFSVGDSPRAPAAGYVPTPQLPLVISRRAVHALGSMYVRQKVLSIHRSLSGMSAADAAAQLLSLTANMMHARAFLCVVRCPTAMKHRVLAVRADYVALLDMHTLVPCSAVETPLVVRVCCAENVVGVSAADGRTLTVVTRTSHVALTLMVVIQRVAALAQTQLQHPSSPPARHTPALFQPQPKEPALSVPLFTVATPAGEQPLSSAARAPSPAARTMSPSTRAASPGATRRVPTPDDGSTSPNLVRSPSQQSQEAAAAAQAKAAEAASLRERFRQQLLQQRQQQEERLLAAEPGVSSQTSSLLETLQQHRRAFEEQRRDQQQQQQQQLQQPPLTAVSSLRSHSPVLADAVARDGDAALTVPLVQVPPHTSSPSSPPMVPVAPLSPPPAPSPVAVPDAAPAPPAAITRLQQLLAQQRAHEEHLLLVRRQQSAPPPIDPLAPPLPPQQQQQQLLPAQQQQDQEQEQLEGQTEPRQQQQQQLPEQQAAEQPPPVQSAFSTALKRYRALQERERALVRAQQQQQDDEAAALAIRDELLQLRIDMTATLTQVTAGKPPS